MNKKLLQFVTAVTLLSSPLIIFAQAPVLGTAANFVLFTTAGAVTNTGTSQLTGNVGTNAGSSTGFGNVNGVMNDNNGASLQAAADLNNAYTQLDNVLPTRFPAPLLGNGDTLVAGVYQTNAVTSLNGKLYLNAQGNANAIFIFQIEAAFSTGTAAKVILLNGAQACNVFWKIEGAVSLASETFFRGNIIAHNAAIGISVNDTLEGRALSIAGAVTTNNVLAYTPAGCNAPLLTGPAAPNMLSTACYTIFSANGSVTNSGVTKVTGDVGTNVGLTTGFDALLVNGTIHPQPDGSTGNAAADLLTIYDYLNVLPHDIQLLYPAQFGNDLVLTPHTYLLNAATSFTGSVILNAQGNADAVFVIKVNGALNTSTFSRVVLINGTQAKNVFWKVEGAVNMNDYSVFNGIIIANNGAVNLTTGDSLNGKAFTTNGALSTSAIAAKNTSSCNSLPVNWLSFTAEKTNNSAVLLKWSTSNEVNNSHFEIERSSNGATFSVIGKVMAGNNAASVQQYSFNNSKTLNGNNFYRLKQVDKDGNTRYSATVKLAVKSVALFSLYPNPATTKTTIQIRNQLDKVSISLIDNYGRKVYQSNHAFLQAGTNVNLQLQRYTKGIYTLIIESDKGRSSEKIVLQ